MYLYRILFIKLFICKYLHIFIRDNTFSNYLLNIQCLDRCLKVKIINYFRVLNTFFSENVDILGSKHLNLNDRSLVF